MDRIKSGPPPLARRVCRNIDRNVAGGRAGERHDRPTVLWRFLAERLIEARADIYIEKGTP